MTTHAETTLLSALDRTFRGRRAKDASYRRLHEALDADETVHAVADGYPDYMSEHLLLLTDRRVLLAKEPFPGRWKTMRDVPAAAVRGARQASGAVTAASIEIEVDGQDPVSLKFGSAEAAGEFLRTLEQLRGGAAAAAPGPASGPASAVPRAAPDLPAAGVLAPGETVHAGFEGYSTWSSEHQQLLLTDRRVVLAGEETPGRWVIHREAAAADVLGVRTKGGNALKAASVEVEARGQKTISLGKGTAEPAQEFVRVLEGLLQQGGGRPRS